MDSPQGMPLPHFIDALMEIHNHAQSQAPAGQTIPMHPVLHNALQLHLKMTGNKGGVSS